MLITDTDNMAYNFVTDKEAFVSTIDAAGAPENIYH
jgi:hypothetical protein